MTARTRTEEEERRMTSLGRVLAVLRMTRAFSQATLARRSGVKRASISEYECGKTEPDASTLERLLSSLEYSWAALDLGNWFLGRLETDCRIVPGSEESDQGGAPLRTALSLAARLHEDVATANHTAATLCELVSALRSEEEVPAPPVDAAVSGADRRSEERTLAQAEWRRLKPLSRKEQKEALETVPPGAHWALCELLWGESQRLCGNDPAKATSLAELALALADLTEEDDAIRAKLRGLSLAHVANASRVRGDLVAADRTLSAAEGFWETGKDSEESLLEEGLIFALKASLRRDQRRFGEAADLLDKALRLAASPTFRIQVLVSQGKLLEETGQLEEAVAILELAKETVSPDEGPRILFPIWHDLADTLSKLGRFTEAAALLPEARRHCHGTGGDLNRIRLSWTEARVAAGLGSADGMALLSRVRGEFASRGLAYDTALVSLELAVAYAGEGRSDQVKTLARHMAPIFQAQEVHREALATLTLFRQAAEEERVTPAFAREVLLYLRRAKYEPDLRFEGTKID